MKPIKDSQRQIVETRIKGHGYINEGKCWIWQGDKTKSGYGRMWLNGKTRSIHRVAYELWCGEIPDGLLIRHSCDRRDCINPDHLSLGTNQDNYDDMKERGRANQPSGDAHYETKIHSSLFREVFDRYSEEEISMRKLGSQYGVSAQTICNIIRRHRRAEEGET